MTAAEGFDASRAWLKQPDMFVRLRASQDGEPLSSVRLPADAELLVVERGGERRALGAREMAYHHLAQGELAGEPYLVSY